MTWDDLVRLALELPDVAVSTSYGTPALKVRGKLLTRLRPEDQSLVLWEVPAEERDLLLEAEPRVFHTTPHYEGHPIVLARLEMLEDDRARHFLERRWRAIAPKRVVRSWDCRRQSGEGEPAAAIPVAPRIVGRTPSPLAREGGSHRQARDG